ncbi:MAG: TIGR02206 family membrane protein [Actinomycetota bacterium]|jgi:hypothetical integral membrane protein (TIGR02206 family)|nr:TIGR02206 family membrane protein [Actinomycetota bacterium]
MSAAYLATLGATAVGSALLVWAARALPAPGVRWIERFLAVLLLAVSVAWIVTSTTQGAWSWATSLPLPLCDVATLVAAAALWWRRPTAVELTYFWGLAGTLQALLTPDVQVGFPSMEFLEYVLAHAGIVAAALFLVVGERIEPRQWSAAKVFAITLAYTGVVGAADAATGGDYMFLRHPPAATTLLSVLGPWPWYLVSAAGVAVVLLAALEAPFWWRRRRSASRPAGPVGPAPVASA